MRGSVDGRNALLDRCQLWPRMSSPLESKSQHQRVPWFTKPVETGGKPVGLPKPPGCGFGKPPVFFSKFVLNSKNLKKFIKPENR
jgi:hypothetical protein